MQRSQRIVGWQELAKAREPARLLEMQVGNQQRLFRRLLDAGRTLEQEDRDDQGKREARAASLLDADKTW